MSYDTRLREARKRAGLTQEELGKLVGCAKTTITGYETGKSEPNMTIPKQNHGDFKSRC